jgi:hypothetical protein
VARFTVLEIWLSFYVMPSLERCSEILLRIKKMNLLIAVKVSIDLLDEFYECLRGSRKTQFKLAVGFKAFAFEWCSSD